MMNPSLQKTQQPWSRFFFLLSIMCSFGVFACVYQGAELTGTWVSTEITHPSPFFAKALAQDKHGNITLFLDRAGIFMWLDHEGDCHAGKYLVQDSALILTESQGEPITLGFAFGGNRLRLKSPDGFVFEFQRGAEGTHAGTGTCDP